MHPSLQGVLFCSPERAVSQPGTACFAAWNGLFRPARRQRRGGGGLSEGQAQRIAIARALLRGRSVMLFDEATSALDPATERQLLDNILRPRDKTVVFITHRPAVVDYCDQTLRLG